MQLATMPPIAPLKRLWPAGTDVGALAWGM